MPVLTRLEAAGLVRRRDEWVRFAHDMFADWARLKHLVEVRLRGSEAAIRRAATAGWYRAVRLYAQRVLEQPGEGVARWTQDVRDLGDGTAERRIVRDLYVEALVLATDPRALLTAAWPALAAGDGGLLHLLLTRFAYVGTVPDSRATAEVEHLFRVPFEPYWAEVLPVLGERLPGVLQAALGPAAKLLRLWLETIVPARPDNRGLRRVAARMALALAREIQGREAEDRGAVDEDVRTDAYVAVLWAAPEFPDEVARYALEVAQRRSESEEVGRRRRAAEDHHRRTREQLPDTNPHVAALLRARPAPEVMFGQIRPPWPDGPRDRVDEAFQAACLDWQAVLCLAVHRPTETLELLLAVVLEHPTYEGVHDCNLAWDGFGLDRSLPVDPPLFHRGPFLRLLTAGPDTADLALTLIIRVVNFATERWREDRGRLLARYGRHLSDGPEVVRVPGPDGWSAGWMRFGEAAWNRARDWHAMPHRKRAFLDVALDLVRRDAAVRAEADRYFDRWEERQAAAPGDPSLRVAVARFGVVVRYFRAAAGGEAGLAEYREWLRSRQEEAMAAERRLGTDLLPLTLAPRCRKWLDEGSPLTADELPSFLDTLRGLAGHPDPADGGTRPVDAVLGGVAVLLLHHRAWVRTDPAADGWCRGQLTRAVEQPPGRGPADLFGSPGGWGWDTFATECGVILLAEDPSDSLARRLVVNGLIAPGSDPTAAAMTRAYRLRDRLGAEFGRMQAFVTEWAGCRWMVRWAGEWGGDPGRVWARECVPLAAAFEVGGPAPPARSAADVDAAGRARLDTFHAALLRRRERRSDGRVRRVLRRTGLLWLGRQCRRILPGAGPSTPAGAGAWDEDEDDDGDTDVYPNPAGRRHGVPPEWPGLDTDYLKAGFAWLDVAKAGDRVADDVAAVLRDLLAVTIRTVSAPPRPGGRTGGGGVRWGRGWGGGARGDLPISGRVPQNPGLRGHAPDRREVSESASAGRGSVQLREKDSNLQPAG